MDYSLATLWRLFWDNFLADINFLSMAKISPRERMAYLVRKYHSILLSSRKITYLGRDFYYDSRFSPVHLQGYPSEIERLAGSLNLEGMKRVLDIGANVGQFAYTLHHFYPGIKIYSFEPNPRVYNLLNKNVSSIKNIICYPFALGRKPGRHEFFFSGEASAEGSFYKDNLFQNFERGDIHKISVNVVRIDRKFIESHNLPHYFDLIKIDVEGAEKEVLMALDRVRAKYVYLEVSINRKGMGLGGARKLIEKNWKCKTKVVFFYQTRKDAPAADALIEIL